MNAKHLPFLVLIAALAGAIGWFAGKSPPAMPADHATANTARKIKFYQSPMHPWIKSDKPGKCTICGMTLVPVYEGEAGIATNSDLITLSASSATAVGVQTAEVLRGPLVRTLRVTGVIDDEETRHRYLSSYTDARITKLFVHTTGVEVTAGQPLAVLYSPDLLTARQEFNTLATTTPDSPLVSMAFKLVEEPFGQITYMRIYQGTISKGRFYYNSRQRKKGRISRILRVHADEKEDIDSASAGDIVAVMGIECATGDTYCDEGSRDGGTRGNRDAV